jgi:tetratricopeptide (TPR) repeat protein
MVDIADIDDRIAKCNKILEDNPNSQIFAALAEAYRKKGQLDQAFRVCQNGLKVHPNYGSAHMVMARINFDKGMYDWAEMEVKKAIDLDGESHASSLLLAEIYTYRGEFSRAAKLLNELIKLDPNNKNILKLLELTKKFPYEVARELGSPAEPESGDIAEEKERTEEKKEPPVKQKTSMTDVFEILIQIPGIEGVLLINREGLVIESKWEDEISPDLYGALAREVEREIQTQLGHSPFGQYENILIEASGLIVNLHPVKDSMLIIKANERVNLGSLRLKLNSLLSKLSDDMD